MKGKENKTFIVNVNYAKRTAIKIVFFLHGLHELHGKAFLHKPYTVLSYRKENQAFEVVPCPSAVFPWQKTFNFQHTSVQI